MTSNQQFEQSIQINASVTVVEQCITDLALMHQWLNPALCCEPVGEWSTDVGSRSRFVIQVPFLAPTLNSVVLERRPGVIVWGFEGFFHGRDTWECQPVAEGTHLLNRFEFEIPNLLIRWGFHTFAEPWTKADMQSQLQRLKQVAERRYQGSSKDAL
ncbi:MAG: SRPBCC family protein [Chroococcidiopsidaceae cyanobacterium CP_BM_RX_35]|nr:SRPBCC family protein [Chroococcidiopsidaceae cyanobacterium CP_BM_RX_35]